MAGNYIFFAGTMGAGGAQRVISILSKELASVPENKVKIITYYDGVPSYKLDGRVSLLCIERETGSKNICRNFLCLRRQFKQHNGVILSFMAPFNILAILAHAGLKAPIIVADRNDPSKVPQNYMLRKLRDFLYQFADAVVVQTGKNKEYFSKKVQKKTSVIYNPIALQDKAGVALKTEKKHQIVTVARLVPQKNHKLLIDAFAKIADEFLDYEVVFYGDGAEREALEQYIESKNLSGRFRLPGNISDVPDKIAGAKLFVLPSDYEGMPNALIEAMCVGLPVISTRVSGATDLIVDGENGILVHVGDADELAGAMKRVLLNPSLQLSMGEKATELNERLSVDKIMAEWQAVISEYVP